MSQSYYKRPELGGSAEDLAFNIQSVEAVVKAKDGQLTDAKSKVDEAGKWLDFWEKQVKVMQGICEKSPAKVNADKLAQAQIKYRVQQGVYNNAVDTYNQLGKEYGSVYSHYSNAVKTYNDYVQDQQGQYAAWKGTIRDADTVRGELETVGSQIEAQRGMDAQQAEAQWQKEQDGKPWYEKLAGYLGEVQDTSMPTSKNNGETKVYVSPQMQALLDRQALLQEELDWSEYFRYADLMDAADFKEESRYKTTYVQGTEKKDNMGGWVNTGYGDINYDYINRNTDARAKGWANDNRANLTWSGNDRSYLAEMTDDEIAIFNYLYATRSPEEAYAYTAYLTSSLNQRQRLAAEEKSAKYAQEHPVLSSIGSVLTSPLKIIGYAGQIADYAQTGKIDENDGYNKYSYTSTAIREQVAKDIEKSGKWGKVGSFAYQTGMSMADFLLTTAITGGNEAVALTIMGTGAAADTTIAAKDRGLDDDQAFMLGTVAGIAEAACEKIGLDAMLGKLKLGKGRLGYVLTNALAEGAEEGLTSFANLAADILISQDKSQWQAMVDQYVAEGYDEGEAFGKAFLDQLDAILQDVGGGFLSGGLIGSGGAAIDTVSQIHQYGKVDKGTQGALILQGASTQEGSKANTLAQKALTQIAQGKDLSGRQLYQLAQQTQKQVTEEDAAKIQKAVQNRLQELGEVGELSRLSEAIARQAVGDPLTETQQRMIYGSQYGQRVANELDARNIRSGQYASDWAGKIGTRSIHPQEYGSRIGEDSTDQDMTEQVRHDDTAERINPEGEAGGSFYQAAEPGTVAMESNARNVTPEMYQQAKRLAEATGMHVRFFTKPGTDAGIDDGWYADGIIHVNTESENPLAQIIAHELTHSLEQTKEYGKLKKLVLDRIRAEGGNLDLLRKAKRDLYAANGETLKNDDAVDAEIVAEYVAKHLLTDERSIQEVARENPSLGRMILDWLNSVIAKLGKAETKEKAFLRRARDLYSLALRQTQNSRQVSDTEAGTQSQQTAAETDAFDADATRKWALDAYAAGQISEETLDQILDDIDAQTDLDTYGQNLEKELKGLYKDPEGQHSISQTFGAEIDAWDGKAKRTFRVGTTSQALMDIGIRDSGIIWHGGKIAEIMRKHSAMTKEIIKQVPEILEHPVAVLTSKQSETRLVIFGTVLDSNGDPVTAILELHPTTKGGQLMDMTVIASAYGKEGNVAKFIENSGLVYLDPDRKRTESWMQSVGLQLPSDATAFGSIGTVTYPDGKVKIESIPYTQYMQSAGNDSSGAQHSISAAGRQDIIRDLKGILDRGGDAGELRQYVEQLERDNQSGGRAARKTEQGSRAARRILAEARSEGLSVEEYLQQNWELYDQDGQWDQDAKEALVLERQESRGQHSFSPSTIGAVQAIGRKSVNAFDTADIVATQELARRYWNEMGTKSPFFRSWFGDWRANDQTPMLVANQRGDTRGVQKNKDTGWDIQVSGQVFNETKVHKSLVNKEARPYLPYINDIVNKAVLLDSYGLEIGEEKSPNSLLMHSLYAVADIGAGPEVLKLYVEEMNDPNRTDTAKRAYQLQNIEKAFNASVRVQGQAPSSLTNASNAIHTVADLFAAVKQMDADFLPNPVSKVADKDGAPKVVYHGSTEEFTTFSYGHIGNSTGVGILGDGFYFTDKKRLAKNYGGKVYPVYLQMKNPYIATESDAYKLRTTDIQAQGYDGVILQTPQGNVYMVLENTQIKSATENVGTFDGSDPDIRHSFSKPATDSEAESADYQEPGEEVTTEEAVEDVRSVLPKKARDYLKRAEWQLLNKLGQSLGVPWYAKREYLQPMVEEISNEYLRSGTVSEETVDKLFDRAYQEGIVVDREFYDQYKDLKRHLQTTGVTLGKSYREDIADYGDFVKRAFGTVKIVSEGGLPVDVAYEELQSMAQELFPKDIIHPADQLVRMVDVGRSIRIAEKSLDEYYGPEAHMFKAWAKRDFAAGIGDILSELKKVKRYQDSKQVDEAALAPATPQEAMDAYKKLKAARRVYEKAQSKNLLTPHDEMQVGRLLKGEIELQHLDPEKDNVSGITAVYEAKEEYAELLKLLADYKRSLRSEQRALADGYLETANGWKDKKIGLAYSRETMRRNIQDIVPDKTLAAKINREYFEPVAVAEAKATRMKNQYRDRVRELKLSTKPAKGDLVSEAHAVQLLGEATEHIRALENSRGRIRQREGKHLSEWREIVGKLWAENPSLDKAKIEGAVHEFRKIYEDLFVEMNQARVRNGYEPISYRKGYFPHFQPGESDGVLAQFGRLLGIDTSVEALPTTINGLTHTFKPGIQWFGNAQERLGFNTAYDAVEGFDKYIEGAASVIFQTDNIQKLRALASQIRYRTSDEGIRKQVDEVYADSRLTEDEKQAQINEIYAYGKYTLSNFVTELEEYTNLLANKKSKLDRTVEAMMGRRCYTILKNWENRVGANMIAGNLSSALTNFIPLTQAGAQMDRFTLLQGMWETLKAYRSEDGLVEMSDFLTNRRGSDPLVRIWSQKASSIMGKPMEFIDCFVADSIVRGAYYQNLKRGLDAQEAMHQADIFAAGVMADRSKGAMPTLFSSVNPLFKAFTQFQLEVNNQFSEVFKDLPRGAKEKGAAALAMVLLKYFLGAFIFNDLYEWLIGRRPALDPIDMLNELVGDLSGYELPNLFELGAGAITGDVPSFETKKEGVGKAVTNLAGNALEELPFSSGLALLGADVDGGRIPAASAVPDLTVLWEALTNTEWGPEKRWKEVQDELNKLAYILTPFGGNQISKTWKGVKAYIEGGSYSVNSKGEKILQYPIYKDKYEEQFFAMVRAMIMGKSSLPEAQQWVNEGFDSLNAKQTAVYQDLLDSGVASRDAYELIRQMEGAEKDAGKRAVLQNSTISREGKSVVYYGMLASNREREVMDALTDLGADSGEVAEVMMQIKDANALQGTEGTIARREAIIDAELSDEEKEILVGDMIGTDMETEEGNPTQYAKFQTALDTGMSVDDYLRYRNAGGDIDDYLELTENGLSPDDASGLALEIEDLEPLEDNDKVVNVQKWRGVLDFIGNPTTQRAALYSYMTPEQYKKLDVAGMFGVSNENFVRYHEIRTQFDANGNGSYSQAEITAAIDSMSMSKDEKAALWQVITGAKKADKNPYSKTIGQKVIDEMTAE